MKVLDLGCGKLRRAVNNDVELVRLDLNPQAEPDLLHDLNIFPWPFVDNTFEQVYCIDVLEHLHELIKVMEELHRISKPGALIEIATPHFSAANSFTDPTHYHHFGYHTLDYFTGENNWDFYTHVRFRKKSLRLIFYPSGLNKLVSRLANRYPDRYERAWTWIFPAWFISAQLEVLK